jgi:hypothetical protein
MGALMFVFAILLLGLCSLGILLMASFLACGDISLLQSTFAILALSCLSHIFPHLFITTLIDEICGLDKRIKYNQWLESAGGHLTIIVLTTITITFIIFYVLVPRISCGI